jgi:hypothetical protein
MFVDPDVFLKQAALVLGFTSCVTPKMTHGRLILSLEDVTLGARSDGVFTDNENTGLRITAC